jgi:tetratricopeptide (TPR) repeat protein
MIFLISFFVLFSKSLYSSNYSDFVDALYYEKKGDYAKSYDIIEKLIKDGEKDPYLYKHLYNLSLKEQKYDKSEELLKEIVNLEPNSSENWLMYGNFLSQEGKNDEAKKAYLKAIELDSENIDAYYQLAVLVSSNTEEAVKYFKKILEVDSSYKADVYYNIGVIYSMAKNEKKMLEYINMAIKENPKFIKPYYFLAFYYESKDDILKAIDMYKKILEIEPDNLEIVTKLVQIYVNNKNYDEAEKILKNFINYDSNNKKALWYLSLLSESKGDFESARNYLSKIDDWQDDLDMVLKMSYYNVMLSDMKKTIGILENAHKKWKDNVIISYYLALGYMDSGDDKKARELFEVVVSSEPDNYEARYNLGVICERMNDVKCFIDNFGYILNHKNPDDHSVLNYLGYSLIDRDLYLSTPVVIGTTPYLTSIEMVEKAVKIQPDNLAYLDSLAWGYYKIDKFEKAKEIMEKVIKKIDETKEKDPLIYEHYADILLKNKDFKNAYTNYKFALKYGSKNIDQIKLKVIKFLPSLDEEFLFDNLMITLYGKINLNLKTKINFSCRKFIFTKEFSYSSNGISFIDPDNDYFSFIMLDPLYTPLLTFQSDDEKYYFEFKGNINEIDEKMLENYAVSFLLNIKNYFMFRKRYYNEGLTYMWKDSCFVFKNLIKNNDEVSFCIKDDPFSFSKINYRSDVDFSIDFNNFSFYREGNNFYYLPSKWVLNIKNISNTCTLNSVFDVENYEFKY